MPSPALPRGGRICYATSADEGKTWSPPTILFDGDHDDRDPSIAQLKDGRLACNFFSLAKPDKPGVPYVGWAASLSSRPTAARPGLRRTVSPGANITALRQCAS